MFKTEKSRFFSRQTFAVELLVVAFALYVSVFLNGALWEALLHSQRDIWAPQTWAFLLTTAIGITGFQVAFISLFAWGRLAKFSVAVFALIAAVTHYFSAQYKVMFDTSMIRNVLETNLQESSELTTLKAAGLVLLYLLPVALLLRFYRLPKVSLGRQLPAKVFTVVVGLGVLVAAAGSQFKSLSSAIRNHGEIRHLVLPASPVLAFARSIRSATAQSTVVKKPLDLNPGRGDQPPRAPLLTVLVVGETVRAQNWGLSGYARQTTPELSKISRQELFNFPYAQSCGTNTQISVPCMFSGIGRSTYDQTWIDHHQSVLPLIQRAGVEVT